VNAAGWLRLGRLDLLGCRERQVTTPAYSLTQASDRYALLGRPNLFVEGNQFGVDQRVQRAFATFETGNIAIDHAPGGGHHLLDPPLLRRHRVTLRRKRLDRSFEPFLLLHQCQELVLVFRDLSLQHLHLIAEVLGVARRQPARVEPLFLTVGLGVFDLQFPIGFVGGEVYFTHAQSHLGQPPLDLGQLVVSYAIGLQLGKVGSLIEKLIDL
jgi:hypothetical protein